MPTLKQINKLIQKEMPSIELVKGDGYLYFVFDYVELNIYETQSIMVPYIKHQTAQQWLDDARAFGAKMGL